VDGIIAPLFYAVLGGAPLAMAYKAINTLDSMVGYKDDCYREFGWFSARIDDAANFIPARLCLIIIPIATLAIWPGRAVKTFAAMLRDGTKNPSPNSGYPEAGFAGALGIQLGGATIYKGTVHHKQFLGDKEKDIEVEDIGKSIRLMWAVSCAALVILTGAGSL
jgi:adenosylcobinamide-phosphate synthase